MCLGLPDHLVASIKQYGGDAIVYICTDCRSSSRRGGTGAGTRDDSAFKQLLQTVKKLCETVQTLSSQVSSLQQHTCTPHPIQQTEQTNRRMIRDEIREMREREKRVTSVIVRGIDVTSDDDFGAAFDPIANHLLGSSLNFSSIDCINRQKKLYRIKIDDYTTRRTLLQHAKNLKNSRYSHIYINRDLTYMQRKELAERRAQAASANNTPSVNLN